MNSKKELEDTITTKLYESRLQAKAFFNDKYQETVKPYKDLIAVVMKANNIKELPALIKILNDSEFSKTNAMAELMFIAATVELIEENYQNHQSPTDVVGRSEQFTCSCGIPPAIRLCEGVETCLKCGDELSK